MGAISHKSACLRILHTSVQIACLSLVLFLKQQEKWGAGNLEAIVPRHVGALTQKNPPTFGSFSAALRAFGGTLADFFR